MSSIRFAIVLGLGLLAPALAPAQVTVSIGPNVNVSRRNGYEAETAITINRADPSQVVIVSNTGTTNTLFRANSADGGATWNTTGTINGCCDPWLGSDTFGNIYLSHLSSSSNPRQVQVARSTDGGLTFSNFATLGSSADHPEMGVGPGSVAGQQSVWVAYQDGTAVRAAGATSTGLGTTSAFTTPQALTASSGGNFGSIAVNSAGQVATTFMTPSSTAGPANLPVHFDIDGTGPNVFVQQSSNALSTNVGGFRSIPAQPNRSIDAQVELKYDTSGGPRDGTLYAIYTQAASTTTNDTNVVVRRSTNNGATWAPEVRVNDDAGTNSQFFSRLAVDPKSGNLAAVWLDAQNSANNTRVELWGSVSTDGGTTWLPNFKISQGQWDGRQSAIGNPNELGDYISMDFYDGRIAVAWADASNSTLDNPNGTANLDIYYDAITVNPVPEPAAVLALTAVMVTTGGAWRRRSRCANIPGQPGACGAA